MYLKLFLFILLLVIIDTFSYYKCILFRGWTKTPVTKKFCQNLIFLFRFLKIEIPQHFHGSRTRCWDAFILKFVQRKEEKVRGEKVERRCIVGLGHRGGHLRHLQEPHYRPLHRVPGFCNLRGVHRRLGHVQSRLPLHLKMAEDSSGLPARQPRLGVPKVRTLELQAYRISITSCWPDFKHLNQTFW